MMTLLDSGKYKVVEVIQSNDDYDVCLCADVTVDDDYSLCIVNTYKSRSLISDFLPMYYEMRAKQCRDFRELITASGSISAVFKYHSGAEFTKYFAQNAKRLEFVSKLKFADSMLSAALEFDMLSLRLVYGALQPGNIIVCPKEETVYFNFIASPDCGTNENIRCERLRQLLREIFPFERYLPAEIDDFIFLMSEKPQMTCVEIYSTWRALRESAEKQFDDYQKETTFAYLKRRALRKKKRILYERRKKK